MTTPISNNLSIYPSKTFKANDQRIAYAVPSDYSTNDLFIAQQRALQKANKKERERENWNKAGVLAQMGIAAAFLTSVGLSLYGMIKMNKGGVKGAGSRAEEELKQLTGVKLNWIDSKLDKNKVAKLDSKTTSKELKKAFNNIISNSGLSDKAKEWGGTTENKMDILYLYGHGGTGKTYIARQYAQEIDALFTCIKYPDIGSPYKDASSMKINNMFDNIIEYANKNKDRKVVVCIDEIDAVMRKVPDGEHGAEEVARSRAALLTGLDKLKQNCSNITVVATSNYHPQNGIVDPIALRRFNNIIEAPLGKAEQNLAMMEMYLKDIGAIKNSKFLESTQAKNFAKKLEQEGYANGEIELICKEAAKIFSSSLKGVKDEELKNHPFKIEYLEEAMKMKGEAASKTNRLMDVKPKDQKHPMPNNIIIENNDEKSGFFRKLFGRFFKK